MSFHIWTIYSSGNEGSVNNANHIQVAATEIEIPEESGQSKHKRVPRKLADTLNGCLCRQVLDSSLNGVLECKQAGCKIYVQYHLQCVEL
ncbi:hypothetical protein L208DRAFT_1412420, partial [Tricholoma matsutake]